MSRDGETKTKTGLVIVSPYGNIWSDEIFETPEAALQSLKDFWRESPMELCGFKLAMAVQVTTITRPPEEPIFVPLPVQG